MTDEEYIDLKKQLPALRKQKLDSDLGVISASSSYLIELLLKTHDQDDRRLIYMELTSECALSGNEELYMHFLRQNCREFPTDPLVNTGLGLACALRASSQNKNKEEAIKLAVKALRLAETQKQFIRYCGANLARIALIVDDYETLHMAISNLLDHANDECVEDLNYEFDFIDQIDIERFDSILLEKYKALQKSINLN